MTMERFDLWVGPTSMRAEWRCVSTTLGGLCVMTCGTMLMPLLCASSLDLQLLGVSVISIVFVCVQLQCNK